MANISFNIACKELKIAQIAQLNQLFQLFRHLVHIYGHGFCKLSHMLIRKNVKSGMLVVSLRGVSFSTLRVFRTKDNILDQLGFLGK